MYPTIVIKNNFSFDTLNCNCCIHDPSAQVDQNTIDLINEHLEEDKINRRVSKYWICKRPGALPLILKAVLSDREEYQRLLKQEKSKLNPNKLLLDEYHMQQLAAKVFANVGYGLFGSKHFAYSNYKVAECITAEGRRIHKQMEIIAQQDPFNFGIVFGFTESIFVNINNKSNGKPDLEQINEFIAHCKSELGITVELKNVFLNSIYYGKMNRFVGWSGKQNEDLVIKGLDGLAKSNPLWVRRWFYKILNEIIRRPEKRFETIPNFLKEAIFELENVICKSKERIDQELKFTQKLKYNPEHYKQSVRVGRLSKLLDKDQGEAVFWFETISTDEDTKGNFSTKIPTGDNLNLQKYKETLLKKLKDTLIITGFDVEGIKLKSSVNMVPFDNVNK